MKWTFAIYSFLFLTFVEKIKTLKYEDILDNMDFTTVEKLSVGCRNDLEIFKSKILWSKSTILMIKKIICFKIMNLFSGRSKRKSYNVKSRTFYING